jgi:hypothetical protein
MMFQHLLNPQHDMVEIASAEMLTAAVVALIEEQGIDRIRMAALPPGATTPTRDLCQRLRTQCPTCMSGLGGGGKTGKGEANGALLLVAGADAVGMTLRRAAITWGTKACSTCPQLPRYRRLSGWGHAFQT